MTSPLPLSSSGFPPFMPSPIFSSSFGSSIVSPPPPLPQPLNFSNGSLKYDSKLETKFEPNLSTQQQMQKLEQAHHQQQQQQAAKYLQQQRESSPSPTLMVEPRENSA